MKKKISKFCKHELLDRSYLVMLNFEDYIGEHKDFRNLPKKLKKKHNKIVSLLYGFYCDISNL